MQETGSAGAMLTNGASVMRGLFRSMIKDENGATAIEYALLASLIAVAIIAALQTVAGQLNTVFSEVSTSLK